MNVQMVRPSRPSQPWNKLPENVNVRVSGSQKSLNNWSNEEQVLIKTSEAKSILNNVWWDFLKKHYLTLLCPLLSLYFPIRFSFSKDSLFVYLYVIIKFNMVVETLPYAVLSLLPIIFGLQGECFKFDRKFNEECEALIFTSVEILVMSGFIIGRVFKKTNLHKKCALIFLQFSDCRPQKFLLGNIITTVAVCLIFDPILSAYLLHPIFTYALEIINNARKIKLSQDGSTKLDKTKSEEEFFMFACAIRLALPFTLSISMPGIILGEIMDTDRVMNQFLWMALVAMPLIYTQCVVLWIYFVVKFLGVKKIWDWRQTSENMYCRYLIKVEWKKMPKPTIAENLTIAGLLVLGSMNIIKLLVANFLMEYTQIHSLSMSLDRIQITFVTAVILMVCPTSLPNLYILGNYDAKHPRGYTRPILNWKEEVGLLHWDVIFYVLSCNITLKEFVNSSIIMSFKSTFVNHMKTGLVGSISVLIGVIMLFTNISHTPTVIWFFRNFVPDLSSKLKLDPCLLNILINVSATYSFLFPISSTHCLICYLSGGITKKDMFANGAVIMTICYITFFASFAQLIHFFRLEFYSPKYEDEFAKNGSLCVLKFGLRKFL